MNCAFYLAVLFACLVNAQAQTCFTRNRCEDEEVGKSFSDQDYWISVNDKSNQCLMCLCAEVKRYTVSCIELDNSTESNVKKNGLINRLTSGKTGGGLETNSTFSFIIRDEEAELPKEEAEKLECGPEPVSVLDPETGRYTYPNLKYVHYMYLEKESYCCSKTSLFSDIDPTCEIKFNNRCEARVVTREDHKKVCPKPFTTTSR